MLTATRRMSELVGMTESGGVARGRSPLVRAGKAVRLVGRQLSCAAQCPFCETSSRPSGRSTSPPSAWDVPVAWRPVGQPAVGGLGSPVPPLAFARQFAQVFPGSRLGRREDRMATPQGIGLKP